MYFEKLFFLFPPWAFFSLFQVCAQCTLKSKEIKGSKGTLRDIKHFKGLDVLLIKC